MSLCDGYVCRNEEKEHIAILSPCITIYQYHPYQRKHLEFGEHSPVRVLEHVVCFPEEKEPVNSPFLFKRPWRRWSMMTPGVFASGSPRTRPDGRPIPFHDQRVSGFHRILGIDLFTFQHLPVRMSTKPKKTCWMDTLQHNHLAPFNWKVQVHVVDGQIMGPTSHNLTLSEKSRFVNYCNLTWHNFGQI